MINEILEATCIVAAVILSTVSPFSLYDQMSNFIHHK